MFQIMLGLKLSLGLVASVIQNPKLLNQLNQESKCHVDKVQVHKTRFKKTSFKTVKISLILIVASESTPTQTKTSSLETRSIRRNTRQQTKATNHAPCVSTQLVKSITPRNLRRARGLSNPLTTINPMLSPRKHQPNL